MNRLAAGELEREARRILRRLGIARSYLLRLENGAFAIARSAASAPHSRIRTSADFVTAFTARDWIASDGPGRFVLSEAGRGWLARSLDMTGENSFANQHRVTESRSVVDAEGREQKVSVNAAESPLARLRVRGLVEPREFEAGERLRRDFTYAQLTPRLGVDWSAPVFGGSRGARREDLSDTVIAAKQRFGRALTDVGPGLGDLLFDVCCHLMTLESAESRRGWPRRSARTVLKIALDRLADHYGMKAAPRTGRIRAWSAEEAQTQEATV